MLEKKSSLHDQELKHVNGGFVPEYEEPDNLELDEPFPSGKHEIDISIGKEDKPYSKTF